MSRRALRAAWSWPPRRSERQGLSGSGVGIWAGRALWEYQGTPSTLQVATGIALGPYGYIAAGGYYLDGDTLAAGVVKLHPY
jgi:hypothetical protein